MDCLIAAILLLASVLILYPINLLALGIKAVLPSRGRVDPRGPIVAAPR